MPKSFEIDIFIKNLKKGDPAAFDQLFKIYNKRIYSFSLSYLKSRDEAEGIVQEVFLNLWKNRKRIKEKANFQAYLFTITFNAIKKRLRKLEREKRHLEQYAMSILTEDQSLDIEVTYQNLRELLKKAIDQLPARQKEVFLLNKENGLNADEIAAKLHLSKRTVENHLFRAKAFLQKVVKDGHLTSLLFFFLFIK